MSESWVKSDKERRSGKTVIAPWSVGSTRIAGSSPQQNNNEGLWGKLLKQVQKKTTKKAKTKQKFVDQERAHDTNGGLAR